MPSKDFVSSLAMPAFPSEIMNGSDLKDPAYPAPTPRMPTSRSTPIVTPSQAPRASPPSTYSTPFQSPVSPRPINGDGRAKARSSATSPAFGIGRMNVQSSPSVDSRRRSLDYMVNESREELVGGAGGSREQHRPANLYGPPRLLDIGREFDFPSPQSRITSRQSFDSYIPPPSPNRSRSSSPSNITSPRRSVHTPKSLSPSHSVTSLHRRPLKILCLDGGGIRGLSSLLILRKVMERVEDADSGFWYGVAEGMGGAPSSRGQSPGRNKAEMSPTLSMGMTKEKSARYSDDMAGSRPKGGALRPCEYFDLICGTSTGGLIALMLGRLRMTVDECIEAHVDLAAGVFSHDKSILGIPYSASRFSGDKLEAALKKVVKASQIASIPPSSAPDPDLSMREHCDLEEMSNRDGPFARTFVLAAYSGSLGGGAKLFRSYDTSRDRADDCAIWQAGRATSAAPLFFPPITLATQAGAPAITYVDAALGSNNPSEAAIIEAEDAFPGVPIGLLLSLGCGKAPDVRMTAGCFPSCPIATAVQVAAACVDITTSSEQVDQRVARHPAFFRYGRYVRLNVDRCMEDIGLEEWKQMDQIATATDIYLHAYSTRALLDETVITLRKLTYRLQEIFIGAETCSELQQVEDSCSSASSLKLRFADAATIADRLPRCAEGAVDRTCLLIDIEADMSSALRFLAKVPHGRYRVSYFMRLVGPVAANHSEPRTKANIVLTCGRPYDARTYATRLVPPTVYKDTAAQLIAPPYDRRIVSVAQLAHLQKSSSDWIEIHGQEIILGLDGYIACVVAIPCSSSRGSLSNIGSLAFVGIRLVPVA